ncbi:MAG: diguanylate cyclase [Atopobiaceae bacterium]|nr:diguanylate cyclase [Atopobiaceae bacterium]
MKSIKRSFMISTVITIVVLCVVLGAAGVFFLVAQSDADATARLSLSCAKAVSDINVLLNGVEVAVQDEVSCIVADLREVSDEEPASWRAEAERLFGNIASHTSGATLYYVLVEGTDSSGADDGFCYYRPNTLDPFVKKEDWEELPAIVKEKGYGWDQEKLRSGGSLWVEPLGILDQDTLTALYVAPIMVDRTYRGYVAMGIDFSVVEKRVADSKLYGNGYAYLVDPDGNVMYHPLMSRNSNLQGDNESIPQVDEALASATGAGNVIAYRYRGEEKRMTFHVLQNDMRLVVTANAAQIYKQRNNLVIVLVVIAVVALALCTYITMRQIRLVLTPLEDLTQAATRAAQGDVDVRISAPDIEEVHDLAKAYNKTVDRMREQIGLIDDLAHVDQLTGLKNRTAFYEVSQVFDERIAAGTDMRFDVAMFDVNDLKPVNDHQGHDAGDELLKKAAHGLAAAFEGHDVYRIGGDEFALICVDELGDLESRMAMLDTSIAWGQATYRKGEDASVSAVLARADAIMYERKRRMKHGLGE